MKNKRIKKQNCERPRIGRDTNFLNLWRKESRNCLRDVSSSIKSSDSGILKRGSVRNKTRFLVPTKCPVDQLTTA